MAQKLTIKDIAEMANTSKTTVSFYLNGRTDKMSKDTYERIKKVIDITNFVPNRLARSLNLKNSNLIGVLIGDITNVFSNQIVKGIEEMASKNGYQIIVGNSNYSPATEEKYIDRMLQMGVDGFIIQPTTNFVKISSKIARSNKPMVFFDSKLYDKENNWVKTNNFDAVYNAINSCIDRGYEDFYLIAADPSMLSTRLERSQGFIDALNNRGLTYKNLVIEDNVTEIEEIRKFFNSNIDLNKNSLIFVPNCWALQNVRTALQDYMKYSPKVGLLGFDNTEWTNFTNPSISTIVQPAYDEGKETARILIDLIKNDDEKLHQHILDCHVNWNDSTDLKI
ncbi:LacI family DNA-binding transcriptional regulator [Helcococcus ovis]|uniref:LacI family DNA-binding transcriptional regulator n=1 Tax=Helcococcus ovis TaxID=72026 RepID=A0A4R9C380_9FIRM|nr:LacI family DNA-binding transcriptional regulator [Helcococcus ovis]TFF64763.1 LacI family DNA-binding transcriptional regulator [Helcococcus ovis]TFF66632.1 LacI family DNA-binding transcriptional regulator [Helcococcus ovis]TFF68007.1 LacI family DNA-binding transcriptional regulator [Helcococcus ovis]WNZ01132.1 LacI family DNA-binding transcriptional regulator [Helcococcus ovis]